MLLGTRKQEPYWLSLKIYGLLAHDKNVTMEDIKNWTTNEECWLLQQLRCWGSLENAFSLNWQFSISYCVWTCRKTEMLLFEIWIERRKLPACWSVIYLPAHHLIWVPFWKHGVKTDEMGTNIVPYKIQWLRLLEIQGFTLMLTVLHTSRGRKHADNIIMTQRNQCEKLQAVLTAPMWAIKLPAQSSAPHHNQNIGILPDGTGKTQETSKSYLHELTWKHKSGNSSTLFFFRCD